MFADNEFTNWALESFYDAVDDCCFKDEDSKLIYQTIRRRLKLVPFSHYLKRYIYQRAGFSGAFSDVPLSDYQMVIRDSFVENHTPASFKTVSSKLSALSKNWLTQQTVHRNVVFLLGFGLRMSVDDVNMFLTKALCEREIHFKDPFETICWYCYKKQYNYLKFRNLWEAYEALPPKPMVDSSLYTELTGNFRSRAEHIQSDAELMEYLSGLKVDKKTSVMSVSARRQFDELYNNARDIIANMYNDSETEKNARAMERYKEHLAHNDRMYEYDKQKHIEEKRRRQILFTREDITPSDVEHVICSAIPLDRHGNLMPVRASSFCEHFRGRKFSRQRLSDVLTGEAEIDRFDLITLNFFLYSQKVDEYPNSKIRYEQFLNSTNRILTGCGMGKMYTANPYECFTLMCILAEDPLGTYADVWEMAYHEEAAREEAALC